VDNAAEFPPRCWRGSLHSQSEGALVT